jgi:hypothetical protein
MVSLRRRAEPGWALGRMRDNVEPSISAAGRGHAIAVKSDVTAKPHVVHQGPEPPAPGEALAYDRIGLQRGEQILAGAGAAVGDQMPPDEIIETAGHTAGWRANSSSRYTVLQPLILTKSAR